MAAWQNKNVSLTIPAARAEDQAGPSAICEGRNNQVRKVHWLSIIFLMVEVIAFIPLMIEVFGDMNPHVLTISAIVFGVGMIGNGICVIVKANHEWKKK